MRMDRIVVPVDFYQHTDGLVDFAVEIAKKLGGKVTLLHVVVPIIEPGIGFTFPISMKSINDELLAEAWNKMNALVERYAATSPGCQGVVLDGDTVDAIVNYVRDNLGDLLIIGTHGYRGIHKIMLGSVADRVLKRVSCPILLYNPYRGQKD